MAQSESHFLPGAARLLDLGGQLGYDVGDWYELYEEQDLPPEVADALAMHSDWAAVGQDLRGAMATVDRLVEEATKLAKAQGQEPEQHLREVKAIERRIRTEITRLASSVDEDNGKHRQMTLFNEDLDPARESR